MTGERSALRGARLSRNWSQSDAARELAALTEARGGRAGENGAATPASLKSLLSRWENGHAVPEPHYRALLTELYGRTAVELGLPAQAPAEEPGLDGTHRLRTRLAAAGSVGLDVLELWSEQLTVARRLDDELGAAGAGELVRALVDELDRTLVHTIELARRTGVAAVLTEAAALAGWQALDQGDSEHAWHRFYRARAAAAEADTPGTEAQAMAGQAAVLVDIGEPRTAIALLDQVGAGASPAARAWLDAARGAARAAAGEAHASGRGFDAAERATRSSTDLVEVPGGLVIELTDLHRWRGHALATLGDPGAVVYLEQALATGVRSARDRAVVHADLAVALSSADRAADAAEHARTARSLAMRIGSARAVALLHRAPGDGRP